MNPLPQAKAAIAQYPAKITAAEFHTMISENPSVFEHWETPLEITEYVNCYESPITHLSQHLTFSGKNSDGATADFRRCKSLKIATGTFHNLVAFNSSGIEKIENLTIINTDSALWAACFGGCKNLKIATGTYPGFVNFENSGIESIQNLHIQNPAYDENFACFRNCPNLHTLAGWDLSKKIGIEPQKLEVEKKQRKLHKFIKETQPEELPFL
jgi:hypothetical protein